MSDLFFYAVCAPPIAFCFGYILGGRGEARYWADHGENGGAVHHKGRFYRVSPEGRQ